MKKKESILKDIGIFMNFISFIFVMPVILLITYFVKCWEMAKQKFKEEYPNL